MRRGWIVAALLASGLALGGCGGGGKSGGATLAAVADGVRAAAAQPDVSPPDTPTKGLTAEAIAQLQQHTPNGAFTFAFIGDNRNKFSFGSNSGDKQYRRTIEHLNKLKPAFVLHGGDFSFDAGKRQWSNFEEMNAALKAPLVTVLGNHDTMSGRTYYETKYTPANRTTGLDDFSFDQGGVRFIGLDTANGTISARQFTWLQAQLDAPLRKVIFTHMPPHYKNWDHALDDKAASKRFMEMVEAAKVDYVLMSHIHLYDDSTKRGVTQYLVSGGAGAPLKRADFGKAEHHMVALDVSATGISHRYLKIPTVDD